MKLAFSAIMIRPRNLPGSIIAHLVSMSAFSHGLGHNRKSRSLARHVCSCGLSRHFPWKCRHRRSNVCCRGQSGRTPDMAGTSLISQKEKLVGSIGNQVFAQPCHRIGPIPAICSWLNILRFGPYAHKQSVPSRGNEYRRLSVREEPWLRKT